MVEVFSVAGSPVSRSENHQCLSTECPDLDILTKLLNTDWFHWESQTELPNDCQSKEKQSGANSTQTKKPDRRKFSFFFPPALGVPGEEVGVTGGACAGTHGPGGY